MGLVVLGLIQAPGWGWGSARTIGVLAAGAVVLAVLVIVESRAAHPMVDVSLFRDLRFTAASGSIAIAFFVLNGFIFLMTQYMQFIKGYGPLSTGVRLLPVAGSVAVAAVVGTRLAVRIGNKLVVTGGLLCYCAALFWTSTVSQGTSFGVIAVQGALFGLGMGLTQAPATEAVMGAVPPEKAGIGSAVNSAVRLFGGTLGVAVIGSAAASLYTNRLASTLPSSLPASAISAANGSVAGAATAAKRIADTGHPALAHGLTDAANLAFMHSFAGGCVVAACVAAAGAITAFVLLPARPDQPTRAAQPAAAQQGRP